MEGRPVGEGDLLPKSIMGDFVEKCNSWSVGVPCGLLDFLGLEGDLGRGLTGLWARIHDLYFHFVWGVSS